jgi:hypothetical protein
MKRRLPVVFLLAFLLVGPVTAQFTLEHSYPTPYCDRLLVPGAGERYYVMQSLFSTQDGPKILWYDQDHNFLSATNTQLPPNSLPGGSFGLFAVTTKFFDDDAGIEFGVRVKDSLLNYGIQIFDDTGLPLSGQLWNTIDLITTTDSARQIISRREIYSVPDVTLVHDFTDAQSNVHYGVLEDGTGVYWYINSLGQLVQHNNDFSMHSVLGGTTPPIDDCWLVEYGWLKRYTIDQGSEIEWYYSLDCGDHFILRFYSGNNLTAEYTDSLKCYTWIYPPGAETGLDHPVVHMVRQEAQGTVFLHALTGAVEYASPDRLIANITDGGDLVYYPLYVPAAASSFPVYDRDYNLWKNFPKTVGPELYVYELSARTFDTDVSSLEITGIYFQFIPSIRIVREDGALLFQADNIHASYASRLPGRPNKLLVRRDVDNVYYTRVYTLPSWTPAVSTAEPAALENLTTTPNPAADQTQVDLSAFEGELSTITVADALGRPVFTRLLEPTPSLLQLPCSDWPSGLYAVTIRTQDRWGNCTLIKH